MNIEKIRSEFPVTKKWAYLNHAAVAPLSRPAATAMRRTLRDAEENGMAFIEQWQVLYERTRRVSAQLIGARPAEIALLKNTTEGIITVANGISWQPGDNVVIARGEFPANVYPWLHLEQRGVEVHWVEEREGRLHVDDYAAAIDGNTRVLSASSVEFFSGFRNDLKKLGELCAKNNTLFIVDAIQSLGAFPLDVEEFGIDALCADAHKWLLGPEGAAIFYCARRAMPKIQPASIGWASVESAYDFLHYDTALHNDARRYENGTLNTVGIAGMKASIELLLDVGIDKIAKRILHLTDVLCAGLSNKGYSTLSSRTDGEKSGIVTFRHPNKATADLLAALRDAHIICTERGDHIRLSPHFYNTESEIEAALAVLPRV
jgi:cysteine desulfurase / selenocysteine lyase